MKNLFETVAAPIVKTLDVVERTLTAPFRAAYKEHVASLYDYAKQNPSDSEYGAITSELLKEVQKINREEFAQKKSATPPAGVLAA